MGLLTCARTALVPFMRRATSSYLQAPPPASRTMNIYRGTVHAREQVLSHHFPTFFSQACMFVEVCSLLSYQSPIQIVEMQAVQQNAGN